MEWHPIESHMFTAAAHAAPTFGGFALPPGVGDLSPVRRTVRPTDS